MGQPVELDIMQAWSLLLVLKKRRIYRVTQKLQRSPGYSCINSQSDTMFKGAFTQSLLHLSVRCISSVTWRRHRMYSLLQLLKVCNMNNGTKYIVSMIYHNRLSLSLCCFQSLYSDSVHECAAHKL